MFPASENELQSATALAERAVAAKATTAQWIYPYFLFAQGLAEYRQGRFDSAIAIMSAEAGTVMGPSPRLVTAMAKHGKGQREEARKTLAETIAGFDWSPAQAVSRDHWIWHVLRREAESLIFPNLPAFLEGKYQPRDNIERLAFLGASRFKGLNFAVAKLYADAFAAQPKLADDYQVNHRYNAARSAALVGCGEAKDGGTLSEAERLGWRKQTFAWLQADLATWTKMMNRDSQADRDRAIKMLTRWQIDPDLRGIREPRALERLPKDEQEEFLALWRDVAAVLDRAKTIK